MDRRPIGVFDSGLGGLTALSELKRIMPNEDIVYFGDSARIPYGTKSPSVIKKFGLQDARFLKSLGVKAILIACGTVSSNCLADIAEATGLPTVGVIHAAAKRAAEVARTKRGRVAVLGTGATVRSGAFKESLKREGITDTLSVACPMFVPLVENWVPDVDDIATNAIVASHLESVIGFSPDATILGCTHYPLLAGVIGKYLTGSVLVNAGQCAAEEMAELLGRLGLMNESGGRVDYYTSDDATFFASRAAKFFGGELDGEVNHTDIENY